MWTVSNDSVKLPSIAKKDLYRPRVMPYFGESHEADQVYDRNNSPDPSTPTKATNHNLNSNISAVQSIGNK